VPLQVSVESQWMGDVGLVEAQAELSLLVAFGWATLMDATLRNLAIHNKYTF